MCATILAIVAFAPKGPQDCSQGWSAAKPLDHRPMFPTAPVGAEEHTNAATFLRPIRGGGGGIGFIGYQGFRCAPPLAIFRSPFGAYMVPRI